MSCSACPHYVPLIQGDIGYNEDENNGKCTLCPPVPTGSYHGDLALWPIVEATQAECSQCRCRGCEEGELLEEFLLLESADYVLLENGDKIPLE